MVAFVAFTTYLFTCGLALVALERQFVFQAQRARGRVAGDFGAEPGVGAEPSQPGVRRHQSARGGLGARQAEIWIGGAALVVVGCGLAALAVVGKRLPAWARTLCLAIVATVWLWGPGGVLSERMRELWISSTDAVFIRESWALVAMMPHWLVFTVPAMAMLMEWRSRSRRWIWLDRVVATIALTICGLFLVLFYWPFGPPTSSQDVVRWILLPMSIVLYGALSWGIIRLWRRMTPRLPGARAIS